MADLQLDERQIAAALDKVLNSRLDEIKADLKKTFEGLKKNILAEVESELKLVVKELTSVLPNSTAGKFFANGINSALGSAISGRKLDARTIANSAAAAFRPAISEFINPSKAQVGDSLLDLFSAAQRNL